MHPMDNLRLLTISYNTTLGQDGPIVERQATVLTQKQPWQYLLDPEIESHKPGTYVTMIHNVVEIPPGSLTVEEIKKLKGRG